MGFFYLPHGAIMNNTRYGKEMNRWTPDIEGRDFDLKPILEPFAPLQKIPDRRQRPRQQAGRKLRRARDHCRRPGCRCVHPRQSHAPLRRCHDRSDRGAAHRPRNASALARGRDRRGRAAAAACDGTYGCAYGKHDLVPHADDAAADGVRSAPKRSRRSSAAARAPSERASHLARLPELAGHGHRARPRR